METITSTWNKLSGSETAQAVNPMQLVEQDKSAFEFLQLTRQQRLICFGACIVGGFAISLLGSILFIFGQIATFALLYTIGVIVSLVGTGFLIGASNFERFIISLTLLIRSQAQFKRQWQLMWDPVRATAAAIFILCIALVFVFAFAIEIDVLVIVFAVATYVAYAWYSLSYIPYARALAKKLWPW
ncbi:hypothetical protein OIV83_005175 [Microbotryomycetes sp. JL201]|nr:hypothetical protein OIV83_005175 [Microbotryomycetes sp. JL201]